MKSNMHIAVSGNIGVGKTSLTKLLSKHFGWKAELEDEENNPYLRDFYGDMPKWSFHLQVYFLTSRFEQVQEVRNGDRTVIQDRTIYEDAHIFAKNLYESGLLDQRDHENYQRLFHSMVQFVKPPDLLIYLQSDTGKLVSNIEKRGRDYEETMRIDYLKNLGKQYDSWIASYKEGRVLNIDTRNLDFVNRREDLAFIIDRINVELNGLFS